MNRKKTLLPFIISTQQFFSVRAIKFRDRGDEQDTEGWEWMESSTNLGLVYGQQYFFRHDFQGFNFGWYFGGAFYNGTGYSWNKSDFEEYEEYDDSEFSILNALEINYHFEWKFLYTEPTFVVYYDTNSKEITAYPAIILGFQFLGSKGE
ncbi:MAG: hypothetical protein JXR07_14230 [Reichenbachiella sp.]